jgi:hypothetical protein
MSSALSTETEKDVLPWLKLAEDLRLLNLDVEVRQEEYFYVVFNSIE